MNKKLIVVPALTLALLGGAAAGVVGYANADTTATATTSTTQTAHKGHGMPGIMGTVSAVNGNTISVTSKQNTATVYTVDATNAKVLKASTIAPTAGTKPAAPTTSSVSAIAVGDTVMVRGTVSGTSVTATDIMDGVFKGGMMGKGGKRGGGGFGGGTMGTVSSISGNTVTLTTKAGGTFTIDASSATVKDAGATSTLSTLKVGDTIRVGGTITSANMTAKNIEDGLPQPATPTVTTSTTTQ
jgi:hypothetical protein